MNRQQRQAKLKEIINERMVCPRIMAVIRGESFKRQVCGLAGAFMQVLMDSKLSQEERANLLRAVVECLIKEMARYDGLTTEQKEDMILSYHALDEPPAGTA